MARKRSKRDEYFDCPACGEPLRVGATFCKECGADEETNWGWAEDAEGWQDELPTGYRVDEDDDEDEWRPNRQLTHSPWKGWSKTGWAIVAIVALLIALQMALG